MAPLLTLFSDTIKSPSLPTVILLHVQPGAAHPVRSRARLCFYPRVISSVSLISQFSSKLSTHTLKPLPNTFSSPLETLDLKRIVFTPPSLRPNDPSSLFKILPIRLSPPPQGTPNSPPIHRPVSSKKPHYLRFPSFIEPPHRSPLRPSTSMLAPHQELPFRPPRPPSPSIQSFMRGPAH
jgi:hypothetical protein